MKIALKIFFIVLSLIMLGWLLKIIVVGAEVLGDANWQIPFIYFPILLYWYIWEKNREIEGLKYDIEYLRKIQIDKAIEGHDKEAIWKT